jgi:hypothetical protein
LAAASNERIKGIAAYLESGKGTRNLRGRRPTLGGTITKRGDYGPGQYDESTYRVLKAGDTYHTTFNLPLTEKFFHDKGTYRIKW